VSEPGGGVILFGVYTFLGKKPNSGGPGVGLGGLSAMTVGSFSSGTVNVSGVCIFS